MNLIELIKNEVSGDVISSLSQKVGISEDQVKDGFAAGIPAVLAGMLKNGVGGAGSGFLDNILSGVTGAGSSADDLLKGGEENLLDKGKSMLGSLFGHDTGAVSDAVSSSTGLSADKSSGLLAMIVPLITGFISKIMAGKGWSVSDLMGKIFESKSDIAAALPQGLSSTLGFADIHVPKVEVPHVEVPKVEVPPADVPKVPPVNFGTANPPKSGSNFFKWLLLILIAAVLIWWIMGKLGCNQSAVDQSTASLSAKMDSMGNSMDSAAADMKAGAVTATDAIAGKLNEAGDFVRELGAKINKKLPDGTELSIAENSVENHLISFIEDKTKPVDKTTWFTFDRLYFETGKSTLKAESQGQLKNIVAILKAYPNVQLKMGGYTDNTGDAELNKKISNERANAAMEELVKLGIDAKRLSAEGYGAEHPIASNDTPEGRAQNRRIDIRVTEK
uniref:OmpA family protein n=1 Tax=Pedobacter schmidteae TaxID=2201271 RepID=UPI000EB4F46F|nr:OmpA family protein [Pedobacter schmidteae]